jgi:hypothetical protein
VRWARPILLGLLAVALLVAALCMSWTAVPERGGPILIPLGPFPSASTTGANPQEIP